MDIHVRGKNVEVTEALKEHVAKKISKLAKPLDSHATWAGVVLSLEKERQIVEVTIPLEGGYLLRGEEATLDMYASIDLVVDKLERQVRKYKTRVKHRGKEKEIPAAEVQAYAADPEPGVVRRKTFPVKPMDVEEALLQIELLGHDFFVFRNAATDVVNVLYRRRDGNFGLLEPS